MAADVRTWLSLIGAKSGGFQLSAFHRRTRLLECGDLSPLSQPSVPTTLPRALPRGVRWQAREGRLCRRDQSKEAGGNLISYFGFTFGKLRRTFHEYRSLFPNKKSSQLHKISPGCVTLAIVGFYVTHNRKRAARKSTTQTRPLLSLQCTTAHLLSFTVRYRSPY
jgi:hypothetical protein